jgi:hypothetical protein
MGPKPRKARTVLHLLFNPIGPAIVLTSLAIEFVAARLARLRPTSSD